ncbi:MAG: MBL fold metallo-hydrolase, partial [Streptomyces sp.]|nr:MBL fold metallo-hydrolase [Streptomyces sp.]
MAYTGEVEVGGPADVRELPGLTITKIATNPFNNNCYFLRDTASSD